MAWSRTSCQHSGMATPTQDYLTISKITVRKVTVELFSGTTCTMTTMGQGPTINWKARIFMTFSINDSACISV